MTPELPEPNYYDKFLGAALGEYCAIYLMPDFPNHRTENAEQIDDRTQIRIMQDWGFIFAYSPFYRVELLDMYRKSFQFPGKQTMQLQAAFLLAVAVRLMISNEVMLEDLMSAVLDYLPPGLIFDNPYREKLLAAQDYLEERQTLVNNILAGDLEGIDLDEIDQRNIARCEVSDDLPGALAAGFYIVAARRNDFKTAMKLAIGAKRNYVVSIVTGIISGACYGTAIIPKEYQEDGSIPPRVEENAKGLHEWALKYVGNTQPVKFEDGVF